ncbi:hypothetical protein [Marinicella sp. W31]|uniref:hypothetical protein n=1 Tax=Marinicella sp. W31 TaxID=3023713 RepID=UPI003756684B
MKLLAIIIAFLLNHFWPNAHAVRPFSWLFAWAKWLQEQFSDLKAELLLIVIVAVPISVFFLVLGILDWDHSDQFLYFVVSVLVLSYTIGPENLETAVEKGQLHQQLDLSEDVSDQGVIVAMTDASLHRWFGVFFWYVVLGLAGALIYRLCERLRQPGENKALQLVAKRTVQIMDYPVAWLMLASLAIATDFERTWNCCKPFLSMDRIKKLDQRFIYTATECAVKACEIPPHDKGEGYQVQRKTLTVLFRMLVVWLVFVSILVIFT